MKLVSVRNGRQFGFDTMASKLKLVLVSGATSGEIYIWEFDVQFQAITTLYSTINPDKTRDSHTFWMIACGIISSVIVLKVSQMSFLE